MMNEALHEQKIGFYLSTRRSGFRYKVRNRPAYWGEKDFFKYYFTNDFRIYSDKISKFIVECNSKTNGDLITRISRIYPHIFIDEVQDLAGWDLELLKLLFNSKSEVLLVGDPRQVTYLTHNPNKYSNFKDGKIAEFIDKECNKNEIVCEIDETSLQKSHRNHKFICDFSSSLYPDQIPCEPCDCQNCRNEFPDHLGVYLVKKKDVNEYLEKYQPVQLRWSVSTKVNQGYEFHNFGKSKGSSFDRVLIYPTSDMKKWIFDRSQILKSGTRAKFYVAITRARFSVGIVCDYPVDIGAIEGLEKFNNLTIRQP